MVGNHGPCGRFVEKLRTNMKTMNTNAVEALKKYREEGHARAPRKKTNHEVKTMEGKLLMVEGLTPKLAIKLFCTECFGYEGNPKKLCTSTHCALFPFRGQSRLARQSDPTVEDDDDGDDEE